MTIWTSTHLRMDKAILFVCDDMRVCSSAQRIAKFHGLRMQTASSSTAALSFLKYRPIDYFLLVVDELITCSDGKPFLNMLNQYWPDHRKVALSTRTDLQLDRRGGLGLYKKINKPVSESELSYLIEEARAEFFTTSVGIDQLFNERLNMLNDAIEKNIPLCADKKVWLGFSDEYLSVCKRLHHQSGCLSKRVVVQDTETFKKHLNRRVFSTVMRASSWFGEFSGKERCLLSEALDHFELKGFKSIDRYINADESVVIAMLVLLQDYYTILGYSIEDMIKPNAHSIKCGLGGRFTYNDLFSPLLSSVKRGVDLTCLKLELFLIAKASNIKLELHFDEEYSISIIC